MLYRIWILALLFSMCLGESYLLLTSVDREVLNAATPNELVCKVEEAVKKLSQQGEDGLEEFNQPNSRWVWKNSYMFVIDCDENRIIAHPFPKLLEDNPQLTHFMEKRKKLCEAGSAPQGGWISYLWTDSETSKTVQRKVTFIKQVKGTPFQVAAGIPDSGVALEDLNKLRCYSDKKVLHIDSYDENYNWSMGILRGIKNVLLDTGVELKTIYMDTKRHTDEPFIEQAALKIKQEIEAFKPDVVIASDDNASKYVVMPFYRDAELPIVFCGINWDFTPYQYPYKNTTGMIEVEPIDSLLANLKQYAHGTRVGYLSTDELSERKMEKNHGEHFGIRYDKTFFVKTFEEWKRRFLELQNSVDMVVLTNNGGIAYWDNDEAKQFVEANTKIPVGTQYDFMMPYALLGITKLSEEQGEWSAHAALKILDGAKPSEIPLTQNKKGKLYINMRISNRLGVFFTPDLLEMAEIIR